jgi:hypothetical protein
VKTIFKYQIPVSMTDDRGYMNIGLPIGAEPLSVGMQAGQPMLWARVDPDAVKVSTTLIVGATGIPLPGDAGRCLGRLDMGPLVFHIFTLEETDLQEAHS